MARGWLGSICAGTLATNPTGTRDVGRRDRNAPNLGGYDFLEDPALAARDAAPSWLPDPAVLIGLGPAVRDDGDRFSLWALPGRKSVFHDGRRLIVRSRLGRRIVRLAVSLSLAEADPYAFAVSPRGLASWMNHLAAASHALAGAPNARPSGEPLTRTRMVHMRALLALDAQQLGASEREVALVVVGETDRGPGWNSSALRANVRYLLRHGRAFRDGRYRDLLRTDTAAG